MLCFHCGKEIADTVLICPNCGKASTISTGQFKLPTVNVNKTAPSNSPKMKVMVASLGLLIAVALVGSIGISNHVQGGQSPDRVSEAEIYNTTKVPVDMPKVPVEPAEDSPNMVDATYMEAETLDLIPEPTYDSMLSEAPTQELTQEPTTSPLLNQKKYEIDTVASNLLNFRSMVIDNQGIVYYINGYEICNTGNTEKLYLDSSVRIQNLNPYLAYDPYHDIVYLLVDEPFAVYDITNFDTPELVMDRKTCPTMSGHLQYESSVTPQNCGFTKRSIIDTY